MSWTDWLYLSARRAKHYGFTHHGHIYGVPAWIVETSDDVVTACPKITLLQCYAIAMDSLFELGTYFIPSDSEIVTPIVIGKPIEVTSDGT